MQSKVELPIEISTSPFYDTNKNQNVLWTNCVKILSNHEDEILRTNILENLKNSCRNCSLKNSTPGLIHGPYPSPTKNHWHRNVPITNNHFWLFHGSSAFNGFFINDASNVFQDIKSSYLVRQKIPPVKFHL